MKELIVIGDGNQIGVQIEMLLFQKQFDEAKRVSEAISLAINVLKERALSEMRAEILIAAGDDLFFSIDVEAFDKRILVSMANQFFDLCNCTLSFGIGKSYESAFLALHKAKLMKVEFIEEI